MGNTCEHCFKGLVDCCSYFGEGCKACYVCMQPCCSGMSQQLKVCCAACTCAQFAICMECNRNPCLILDQSTPEIVEALQNYTNKAHFFDDWFGDVILLEHNQSKSLVVMKTAEFYYEKEYKEQYNQFQQRKKLTHNNIVQLRGISRNKLEFLSRQEQAFCTSNYKSFLIFDYILTDLATEYEQRIEIKNYYQEQEFYPIMYQAVAGMAYLNSQQIYHGALRMRNIFITPEFIKIADPHLFDHQNDYANIYSERKRYSQFVLLSPELVSELDKGTKDPQIDWFKSDVYSLGMVFLEICSQKQSSQCYDYEQGLIFEDKINSHLQTIKVNCHDFLYFTIKNMLTVKPSQRPSFQQIFESLDKNPKSKQPIFQPAQIQPEILQQSQVMDQPLLDTYDQQGLDMFGLGLIGTEVPQKQKDQIETVKERYPDGSKYIGSKKNGLRHGKGKFIHQDGGYYDGQWKDNKMCGKGSLYNNNGKVVYDGNWSADQYNGMGIEYNQDTIPMISQADPKNLTQVSWVKYEGNFKNDLRDGFGTLSLSNGDKYIGGFKNGAVHGHGTYQGQGKQPIQGKWAQGIMQK